MSVEEGRQQNKSSEWEQPPFRFSMSILGAQDISYPVLQYLNSIQASALWREEDIPRLKWDTLIMFMLELYSLKRYGMDDQVKAAFNG